MVTRTELTQRVEVLEQKVLTQINLTDRITALELICEENTKTLQNLTVTSSLLSESVVNLQKELTTLKSPKKIEKKVKQKKTKK